MNLNQKRSLLRRLLAAGLAFGLALLPGCGAKSVLDPKNPVSIEIWHYYNGTQKLAFDALVSEFNETAGYEKGVVVEAYSKGNVNELTQAVMDAVNRKVGAEDVPDVFAAYADTAWEADRLELVAALDPYLSEEEIAAYMPDYIGEGRLDNEHLKIFPIAKSTEIMIVNKTNWEPFAAATGASLEELSTVEGVTDIARRYYEWTDGQTPEPGDGRAFYGRDSMANYMLLGARQLGMEIFDLPHAGGDVVFRTDEDVMRRLWDNYYVPFVNGWFAANGRFRSDDAKTGDIIALVGSTSGAAYFPEEVTLDDTHTYPIEAAVLPPPRFEGGSLSLVQQGAGMVVSKSDAAHETASVEFLKWFTEAQRNIDFSIGSGYLPVKREANDRSLVEQSFAQAQEASPILRETILTAIDTISREDCELYTSKAFEGGTEARAVLENTLFDCAMRDREAVLQLVASGTPYAQAVARFCTDESFQQWLAQVRSGLDAAVGR